MSALLPLVMLVAGANAADETPAWVKEAAALTVPRYPAKVDVVVLLSEEQLSIENDGKRVMRERGVLKCVAQSGRCGAAAYRTYNAKSGKIRDFRGWLLPQSGKEIRFAKERIVDASVGDDSVEVRSKALDPGDEFRPGSVFAYEAIEEEKSVFTQTVYSFQGRPPVLISRFIASLPPGWEVNGRVFNRDGVAPQSAGNTHTWELRNLPWIEPEESSPHFRAIAPWLALTFYPTSGNAALRPLKDWPAVSAWLGELSDSQSQVTPAIEAKAAQLTASATDTVSKIRAIATFAQRTKYVSIQMNLTRGGGYVPHRADDVLQKNYGDCKDKANLMKALLKAAGIESYLTAIYSGTRDFVRPEWPSTYQFNHMIIAVRVPKEVTLGTVLEHAALGRLLIFDPTDPHTPLGGLDEDEQGSHALVIAGAQGALVRMPLLPAAANRTESETTAQMTPDGATQAKVSTRFYGQAASSMRRLVQRQADDELKRLMEGALTRRLGGLTLNRLTHKEDADQFDFELDFAARQFGQIMQGRLLIVRPGALLSGSGRIFRPVERKLPIKLSAEVRRDKVSIQLPAGFKVDEMPDPVSLNSPYGRYSASWKAQGDHVAFEQALELHDLTAPATDYTKVREFFEQIAGAESGAVVLIRN